MSAIYPAKVLHLVIDCSDSSDLPHVIPILFKQFESGVYAPILWLQLDNCYKENNCIIRDS